MKRLAPMLTNWLQENLVSLGFPRAETSSGKREERPPRSSDRERKKAGKQAPPLKLEHRQSIALTKEEGRQLRSPIKSRGGRWWEERREEESPPPRHPQSPPPLLTPS